MNLIHYSVLSGELPAPSSLQHWSLFRIALDVDVVYVVNSRQPV